MNTEVAKIFSRVIFSDTTVNIKLLGDSITHGQRGTGFEEIGDVICEEWRRNPNGYCWANLFKSHMEGKYNCKVINNGIRGKKIDYILEHYDTLVDESDDIVICTIGSNDRVESYVEKPLYNRDEYLKMFYEKILILHDKLVADGKTVIFVANIPATDEEENPKENYVFHFHMSDVADVHLKASVERGFPFVCLYTLFMNYCDSHNIAIDDLLADKIHPNDKGYEVMFKLLMDEFGIAREV